MQNLSDQQKLQRSPFKGFLPFLWLALAALGGICLADWLDIPRWVWILGVGLSLLLWVLARALPGSWPLTHNLIHWTRADNRLPGIVLAAVFFIAGWRYSAVHPEMTAGFIGFYNGRGEVQAIGEIVRPPDPRDTHTNLILRIDSLELLEDGDSAPIHEGVNGMVLIQVPPGGDWAYGDRVSVQGELETPFETAEFSYRDYLGRKGVYSIMPYARVRLISSGNGSSIKTWLYHLRGESRLLLDKIFPSPESDLLAGILLGLDQGLSPALQDAFQKTGTTHIIAISGFNMAILAGIFTGFFTRLFGRRWGALAAILGISFYTIFVGGEAAVLRAAIMGGLGVLGGMFGRRQSGLNSLGLAVFGMILLEPDLPWDIGFQLSAAATLGLVLFAQPLEEKGIHWLERWLPEERAAKVIGPISEMFLFTLAAQVMTLPIIAYHFGGLSWITFLANPLILPPQPLVLILGGLALLVGLVLPGLGSVFGLAALPFVRYTIQMVTWLAKIQGGELVLPTFHPLWLLVFYGALFGLALFSKEKRKEFLQQIRPAYGGILILAGLTFFVWTNVLTQPDDRLHLTLLDSEGTILVQAPGGGAVLIGGGPSPTSLKHVLGERLHRAGQKLDWVIVPSPARDDLNGLLGGIDPERVDQIMWGIDPQANLTSGRSYTQFINQPIENIEIGQTLHLSEDINLRVMFTDVKGAVFWLEWENFRALLPAGKVGDAWMAIPEAPDVVLLPDDVCNEDFPLPLVNSWSPAVILLPLNTYDLPLIGQHDLVTVLEDYPLITTLDHGWVKISTDGDQIWVEAER